MRKEAKTSTSPPAFLKRPCNGGKMADTNEFAFFHCRSICPGGGGGPESGQQKPKNAPRRTGTKIDFSGCVFFSSSSSSSSFSSCSSFSSSSFFIICLVLLHFLLILLSLLVFLGPTILLLLLPSPCLHVSCTLKSVISSDGFWLPRYRDDLRSQGAASPSNIP